MIRKFLGFLFIFIIAMVSYQCAQRGTPTGGPRDITPPALVRAEPPNMTTNFNEKKIRLYFNELVKLKDIQKQLIVSPPLKYPPILSPLGNANKFVEITIKDTLEPNTTYTLNFGQGIVDNNEENPIPFFSYVFSTGDYIDSLELAGVVKDAFNKDVDDFVSVMLYKIDSTYNDSTLYRKPPNYITNTLDSAVIFRLKNLKEGKYALFAIKDASGNNLFDQKTDKIGFIKDTIDLPTDSIYLLNLFKEVPDYGVAVPSMVASNKISFGYFGDGTTTTIETLSQLPDTVQTMVTKERGKVTSNICILCRAPMIKEAGSDCTMDDDDDDDDDSSGTRGEGSSLRGGSPLQFDVVLEGSECAGCVAVADGGDVRVGRVVQLLGGERCTFLAFGSDDFSQVCGHQVPSGRS